MEGFISYWSADAGRGYIVVPRSASRRRCSFRFEAAAVTAGAPAAGRSVQFAVCWPSTGGAYAMDVRVLGSGPRGA
jgi:hypothetical protein